MIRTISLFCRENVSQKEVFLTPFSHFGLQRFILKIHEGYLLNHIFCGIEAQCKVIKKSQNFTFALLQLFCFFPRKILSKSHLKTSKIRKFNKFVCRVLLFFSNDIYSIALSNSLHLQKFQQLGAKGKQKESIFKLNLPKFWWSNVYWK